MGVPSVSVKAVQTDFDDMLDFGFASVDAICNMQYAKNEVRDSSSRSDDCYSWDVNVL